MAVIPLEKVHIIIHKSIKDEFLKELQKEGIVHISELKETQVPASEDMNRVNNALTQLAGYKKRGVLEMFLTMKKPVDYETFERTSEEYDHQAIADELLNIRQTMDDNHARLKKMREEIEALTPWKPMDTSFEEIHSLKKTTALTASVPGRDVLDGLIKNSSDIYFSSQEINEVGPTIFTIFFVANEQADMMRSRLIETECMLYDFHDLEGRPADIIERDQDMIAKLEQSSNTLKEQEIIFAREISKLELISDYAANRHSKDRVAVSLPETSRTMNIIGWIQKRNTKKLGKIVQRAKYAAFETIEPEPGEKPPVALQNPGWTRPYEMLVRLYSMPETKEYDPTPFLAVFFPIMFGLCITDVIYGVILILLSIYLLRKVTGDRSLMWILLGGGICTIFAGAMVGSWASNLFELIGLRPLVQLRQTFMLFDPLTSPLAFIGLALGLGFIHMMLGIVIEIVDSIRNKTYQQAIFANLTWFVLLPGILLYFIVFRDSLIGKTMLEILLWISIAGIVTGSYTEIKARPIDHLVWAVIVLLGWVALTGEIGTIFKFAYIIKIPAYAYLLLIPLLAFEIARFRESKAMLGKIAWGFYNLYGFSTYLSVILSYMRLMALGLVTGVIGMAINTIAWMILKIPVIGIVFAILILIGGHLFNIAVNVLGGFIHTMRLQYIEFFGRFYSGGSKPFRPFGFETKYVNIE